MFASSDTEELHIAEIDAARAAEAGDVIGRMVAGSIAGIIVRGVLTAESAAELVRRLEPDTGALPVFRPPVFKGRVFGRPLVSATDGLSTYFDAAERFRVGAAELVADYPRLEQRIHDALTALAGGRPVGVPRSAGGRRYLAATIRVLIDGDRLPLHYENETLGRPVMNELRPALDLSTLMSFYIPLAVSASGGILRLFRTHCLDGGDSLVERLGGEERARAHFERRGFLRVLPGIGDLLVFDGGRWYHDVTPVEGGARWTLGGFLALTGDGSAVHYWS